jgi:deoxyribodipyrimidine photo-lyase
MSPDTKNAAVVGGRWIQEIAWRDFYVCILAGFPRVSMGRPFQEKYANVVWEGPAVEDAYTDGVSNPLAELTLEIAQDNIEKWKSGHPSRLTDTSWELILTTGRTGFPIVDAGMRCLNEMG